MVVRMSIVMILILGGVIGFIAQMLMPGRGLGMISTVLVGVAGSYIGQRFIADRLDRWISDDLLRDGVAALLGAMVLILVINVLRWLANIDAKTRIKERHRQYANKHKYVRTH